MFKNSKLIFLFISSMAWAGQNSGAGIRFDLNSETSGNQNQSAIDCPGVSTAITVDVYVVNASNLDTYEFNFNYNTSDLEFLGGSEIKFSPYEQNFLTQNGGSTTGFTISASNGVVNCSNTLVGDQGENTPDGGGLLATVLFQPLVDCPAGLSFGDVYWYDNAGVKDTCTDKGEDVSLPIEFLAFDISLKEKGVLIEWSTASELNNRGFNILRSESDSTGYGQINGNLIEGLGNSSAGYEYSYLDDTVQPEYTYYYKIEQVDTDGLEMYFGPKSIYVSPNFIMKLKIPSNYNLAQNYPNPFNPVTTIPYQLPENSMVTISVLNVNGQIIKTLINRQQSAGYHFIRWDGNDTYGNLVASGIYFYELRCDNYISVKKMLLIR